jgi:hypothetical protein
MQPITKIHLKKKRFPKSSLNKVFLFNVDAIFVWKRGNENTD